MKAAQLATAALAVAGALLLTACGNITWTSDQALEQKHEAEKAAAAEETPEPVETPDDYTVEEFISSCIDSADNKLHFWYDSYTPLHIRARDAKTWIASDGEYYADFPNQAVPGTHWYCRSDSKWFTQPFSDEGKVGWLKLRGPVYNEIKPDLHGDAYYRVSQEPDTSWQDDPDIQ